MHVTFIYNVSLNRTVQLMLDTNFMIILIIIWCHFGGQAYNTVNTDLLICVLDWPSTFGKTGFITKFYYNVTR